MSDNAKPEGDGIAPEWRQKLIARPDLILSDLELMRALMLARDSEVGGNVIDIRGRAMEALESRLDRLEAAHEGVISAAYENLSGTNTIHRAVISLLEPQDLAGFVENLGARVAPLLRVESLRLLSEVPPGEPAPAAGIEVLTPGTVEGLLSAGRRPLRGDDIVLRRASDSTARLHDTAQGAILSEALLPLELGPDRRAILLMGSVERGRFTPAQGTDLLRFLGQVTRLALVRWLAP
ncbi:DUF484 family protein [Paracoccus pacificus]|uniref:DUF484 family protein n=1 Tax=Paracoccus pacificus TaxID=1463598 RepID=A0ABW4R8H5_9RHOB